MLNRMRIIKLMKKTVYILFVLVFVFFYSCTNKEYYYPIPLNFKTHTQEYVDTSNINELLEVSVYINDTIKKTNTFVLEIPYKFYVRIYQGDKLIARNDSGQIVNPEKNFLELDSIPVTPFDVKIKYLLVNKVDIEKSLRLVFYKKKHSYEYLKKVNLWEVTNEELNEKQLKTFSIKTSEYFKESKLPIIKINSDTIITDKKQVVTYSIINNKNAVNLFDDKEMVKGKLKMKIRGQSSKFFSKKSYSIKFINEAGKKANLDLLGMPKENEWILYGPYVDLSLMRNVLAYDLYNKMGHYSPRTRYCQLIINNDYKGLYVIIEKIKRDKNRLNIKKFKNEDNPEFIVKIDKGKEHNWRSPYLSQVDSGIGKWIYYVYPKPEKMNEKQKDYIRNTITNFENLLVKGEAWQDVINENSFVDYLIINELTKNIDAYRLSTYLYVDSTKKINIGPVWDYNFSMGLTKHNFGYSYKGFVYETKEVPFWWRKFMKNEKFKSKLKTRWTELRASVFSDENLILYIDNNQDVLKEEVYYNSVKWNSFISDNAFRYYNAKSYEDEVTYLKEWYLNRLKYLDDKFK